MAIIKIGNPAIDLDAAEIPNLDTAKITTGTFADARIASSNVSQHATTFDDNAIVNDLSTIALRQATNENAIAYNTNSSFIDVFQDSSGIASHTTSFRNANEYVTTVSQGSTAEYQTSALDSTYVINHNMNAFTAANMLVQSSYGGFIISPSGYAKGWGYNMTGDGDFGSNFYLTKIDWFNVTTSSRFKFWKLQSSSNGSTWSDEIMTCGGASTNSTTTIGLASDTDASNTGSPTTPFSGHLRVMYDGFHAGDNYCGVGRIKLNGYTLTANATGNFIGNTITAPTSTSKMGAIITYQDQAGTNALNTDIILQLSADNGSTYSTATLTALPNYSTGIKMAKVNDLAVTAGTQLKYKISFANQASGSKEARIRGVSLQY